MKAELTKVSEMNPATPEFGIGDAEPEEESEGIWRLLDPRVNALITQRILMFHRALVERGQIKPIPPKPQRPD